MQDKGTVTVYFGGEARELWTGDGLRIAWSGRPAILARRDAGGIWRASAPEPGHFGDVKSDYNAAARERELSALLNSETPPPLTAAYFSAAADTAEALGLCMDHIPALPGLLGREVSGGFDALILPELLRVLLDECALSWKDAADITAACFTFRAGARVGASLSAVADLSPRCARLISAADDKLRETLWCAFPGDRRRIASGAAVTEGEVDFGRLCAALCGRVVCSAEQRAGDFRTLYTAMPEKFEVRP